MPHTSPRARRALMAAAVALLPLLLLVTPASASGPVNACGTASSGFFRCFAEWSPASTGTATPATGATVPAKGLRPSDLAAAYSLDPTRGAGQTVAIVDAYDDPHVEHDLATYRAAWGLPPCTTANGCFRKADQRGGKKWPQPDPGWGVEISLDVQAVSAACPACHILLVEGDDPSFDSLGIAVGTAIRLGASVVSNSYGANESSITNGLLAKYYNHPGTAIVASSGDYGFTTAQFPAVGRNVIGVGGTTLRHDASGWHESAWSGAGSGCSAWVPKPSWQTDAHCSMRTTSDVSAVANPETGLAVYDSYGLGTDNGWIVVGGTSLAAPLIAGVIGAAGDGHSYNSAWRFYQPSARAGLNDPVGGSNGFCGKDYLCTGQPGYDAPTGNGSPHGLTVF